MSLHDRIMAMDPKESGVIPESHNGYVYAQIEAAQIAKEADELMAEMAEALVALRHEMIESGNYRAKDFGWPAANSKTDAAIAKYNTYMEGKQ